MPDTNITSDQSLGVDCFDEARQRFLVALREMLADRSIPENVRAAEVLSTISAISQIGVLSGVSHGE